VSKRVVRDTIGRLFPEKSSELSRGRCQKLAGEPPWWSAVFPCMEKRLDEPY